MSKDRTTRRRLQLLAGILKRLKCPVCPAPGTLRYWPRFAFPIDVDIDPTAQVKEVKRLVEILRASKVKISADPLLIQIFLFHDEIPRQRLGHILKRAELRHENAITNDRMPPSNLWLVATWLAESLSNWSALRARLGFEEGWRSRTHADVELEEAYSQLEEIGRSLMAVHGRTDSSRAVVVEARRLIAAPEFSSAAQVLVEHYRIERRSTGLAQYRFREKRNQES